MVHERYLRRRAYARATPEWATQPAWRDFIEKSALILVKRMLEFSRFYEDSTDVLEHEWEWGEKWSGCAGTGRVLSSCARSMVTSSTRRAATSPRTTSISTIYVPRVTNMVLCIRRSFRRAFHRATGGGGTRIPWECLGELIAFLYLTKEWLPFPQGKFESIRFKRYIAEVKQAGDDFLAPGQGRRAHSCAPAKRERERDELGRPDCCARPPRSSRRPQRSDTDARWNGTFMITSAEQ